MFKVAQGRNTHQMMPSGPISLSHSDFYHMGDVPPRETVMSISFHQSLPPHPKAAECPLDIVLLLGDEHTVES